MRMIMLASFVLSPAGAVAQESFPPATATPGEVGAAPVASATPATGKLRLGVMDVEITGGELDPAVANSITSVLAAQLQLRGGDRYEVISRNELRGVIAQQVQAQQSGCDTPDCLADIGQMARANHLVTTTISKVGEEWVFTLQLVDVNGGTVIGRQAVSWKGDPSGLVELCRPYVARLLDTASAETYAGSLQVMAAEEEAVLHVNDTQQGATPVKVIPDLPIGKHRVRITKDGYLPYEHDVVVNRNETTVLQVQLIDEASLEPWYYKWWVWAGVGGIIAIGAGITAAILATSDTDTTLKFTTPLPGNN